MPDIPAMVAAAATLFALSSFRWIESRMPTEFYAQFHIKFKRASVLSDKELQGGGAWRGPGVRNAGSLFCR